MSETIARVRQSAVAILRIREVHRGAKSGANGQQTGDTTDYSLSFGSGFCVLADQYVVTAFHVLNEGAAPDPNDRHYVFTVPDNGEPAYHFPVTSIPVQHPELDVAVLEIGPCSTPGIHVSALPVDFRPYEDGQRVLTLGFPAPEVHGLCMDPDGGFVSGQFFLKSHANEGIVSAHYQVGSLPVYELNVTWHNGESGGPIVALGDSPAAFSLMQQYRNVQTPHGIMPGPRRGVPLSTIASDFERLGIAVGG